MYVVKTALGPYTNFSRCFETLMRKWALEHRAHVGVNVHHMNNLHPAKSFSSREKCNLHPNLCFGTNPRRKNKNS